MLFGIPDKIFIITLVLAAFGCVLLYKIMNIYIATIFSIVFLIILFRPLIVIHKHDNNAWLFWLATLWSSQTLTTQYTTSLKRNIIILRGNTVLTLNSIHGIHNEINKN